MEQFTGHLQHGTTDPAPPITCYPPSPHTSNQAALIIFPGGAYQGLAEHEGAGYAEYFTSAGFTCFVVTYRLGPQGHRHPAMLEDALAAIETVRSRARHFHVHPGRIGVMGSSAGGHLAAHAMVSSGRVRDSVNLRPDFGVLGYPVINLCGAYGHGGSCANLLGENAGDDLKREVSPELHVTAATPPCFLWHTLEDQGVPIENSLLYAAELRRHGVPFELHVYEQGRHGLGLGTTFDWGADCVRWLRQTIHRLDQE